MRLPTMIAAAALLFPAATLAAQDAAPFPAVVLTDETLLAEVAEAEERGRMLWLYDQAAWHATDSFLAEFDQDKLGKFMRGYIVVPREDELLDAIFFGEFGNGLVEVARYSVDESTVIGGGIHPAEARPALAKSASQLASVRQAALESAGEQRLTLCARANPNTIALPNVNGENYEVYEITPPTSKENYPIGGHYRMQVTPEGRVLSTHRFAESCSAILLPAIPDDAVSFVSTGISHDSDPTPTEIHVFASYHRAVALGVFTTMSDIQWFVDRGAIVRAQLSEEKPSE